MIPIPDKIYIFNRKPDAHFRTAAAQIGISVEEYMEHWEAGERRCSACKTWHPLEWFIRENGEIQRNQCLAFRRKKVENNQIPTPENWAVIYTKLKKVYSASNALMLAVRCKQGPEAYERLIKALEISLGEAKDL